MCLQLALNYAYLVHAASDGPSDAEQVRSNADCADLADDGRLGAVVICRLDSNTRVG